MYDKFDYSKFNINFIHWIFFFSCWIFFFKLFFLRKFNRKSIAFFTCTRNEILVLGIFILSGVILFFYILEIQKIFNFLSQLKYPLLLFGTGLCFHYIIEKKTR